MRAANESILRFENVSKVFQGQVVLNNLSLEDLGYVFKAQDGLGAGPHGHKPDDRRPAAMAPVTSELPERAI